MAARTKILAILIIATLITIASIIVYKPSPTPSPNINNADLLLLSSFVKSKINSVVTNIDHIIGIQVVTVNLTRNVRLETYFKIENTAAQSAYDAFVKNKIADPPVFSTSVADNTRVMKLISGEFFCIPFTESTAYKYAPAAQAFIKYICAVGIPPNKLYQFSGIITVYLSEQPTPEQIDEIRLFSREISYNIADENNLIYDKNKP